MCRIAVDELICRLVGKLKNLVKLRDRYCEIARTVTGRDQINIQCGVCPDQCVGSINDFESHANAFPRRVQVTRKVDFPCVILVMESPHKDEFIGGWGPAKGATGAQIRRHFGTIVAGLGGQLSELILVNAIQYQCSLGVATHLHRDHVFQSLWESGGSVDFEKRLKAIYRPQDMLFNCCTGSDKRIGRRQFVTASIRNSLGAVSLYSGPHPSGWFSERNRVAVRLLQPSVSAAV